MGGPELDRHMASLQPCIGVQHWPNGISKLKQLTGKEHCNLEKILVIVIAGAVPYNVLRAIRMMLNFIFQAQSVLLYEEQLHALGEAL